ncbi:Hypothetical protein FKW44_001489 [Caligus rogercresseyi]|uniref:Uncharacterized protein n=1 Tax=Caligus rogercresseyi TaxID=217165 RepID=A0A7T8KIT8_CALRO|nr:Hypothetical protein FKW44_001489 [Caligus rogercresseyi]
MKSAIDGAMEVVTTPSKTALHKRQRQDSNICSQDEGPNKVRRFRLQSETNQSSTIQSPQLKSPARTRSPPGNISPPRTASPPHEVLATPRPVVACRQEVTIIPETPTPASALDRPPVNITVTGVSTNGAQLENNSTLVNCEPQQNKKGSSTLGSLIQEVLQRLKAKNEQPTSQSEDSTQDEAPETDPGRVLTALEESSEGFSLDELAPWLCSFAWPEPDNLEEGLSEEKTAYIKRH